MKNNQTEHFRGLFMEYMDEGREDEALLINLIRQMSERVDELERRLLLAETGQMVTDAIVDVRTGNQRLPGWRSGTESD